MIIKLKGHEVAYAYGYLANAYGLSTNEPVTRPLGPDATLLTDALDEVEQVCRTLELPITLDYIPTVRRALTEAKTYSDIQNYVGQLRERMHSELKSRLFLFVPPIEARFYNVMEPFGPAVARKFSKATNDMENAGDCIALGVPTPAVFCLMRVMERGVQRTGRTSLSKLISKSNCCRTRHQRKKGGLQTSRRLRPISSILSSHGGIRLCTQRKVTLRSKLRKYTDSSRPSWDIWQPSFRSNKTIRNFKTY